MPYQLYGSFKGYQRATLIILSLDEIYCTEKSAHVFQSKNRILQRKKSIPLAFVSVSEFACLRVLSFLRESVTRPRMVKGWQIELKRRTDWVKQSQRQKKKDQVNCQSNRQRERQTQKQRDGERNHLLFLLFFSQYIVDNSRKIVRWSAVPVAPKLVYVRCGGERGSGPKEPMTYKTQGWD